MKQTQRVKWTREESFLPARFDFKRPHLRGLHGQHVEYELTSALPPSAQNVKLSAARTVEHAFLTRKMTAADAIFRCGRMVRKKGCTPAKCSVKMSSCKQKRKRNLIISLFFFLFTHFWTNTLTFSFRQQLTAHKVLRINCTIHKISTTKTIHSRGSAGWVWTRGVYYKNI